MNKHGRRTPTPDFTEIDGVGRKTAKALESAGIASMTELAAMTVDELVLALTAAGAPAPAGKIISGNWLQQAWRLARTTEADQEADLEPTADAALTPEPDEDAATWEEYAGYFVYFDRASSGGGERWRTRVWDTRAMVEEDFDGAAPGPWIGFVLGRANLPASAYTPGPVGFEVGGATIEHRDSPQGDQTWLRADLAIDVQGHGALEAALGAALLKAVGPETELEGGE